MYTLVLLQVLVDTSEGGKHECAGCWALTKLNPSGGVYSNRDLVARFCRMLHAVCYNGMYGQSAVEVQSCEASPAGWKLA